MTSADASLAVCSILPERQATTPTAASSPQSGAFYSPEAFVDAWIGPRPKVAPITRDFTFKAVIGECPF